MAEGTVSSAEPASEPVATVEETPPTYDELLVECETLRETNKALAASLEQTLEKCQHFESQFESAYRALRELEAEKAPKPVQRTGKARTVRALVNLAVSHGIVRQGEVDDVLHEDLEAFTPGVHYEEE